MGRSVVSNEVHLSAMPATLQTPHYPPPGPIVEHSHESIDLVATYKYPISLEEIEATHGESSSSTTELHRTAINMIEQY